MNFAIKRVLSNVRPAGTTEAQLITTPTKGTIKLNAPASEKMGVYAGDFLQIVEGPDGHYYVAKRKEDGNKTASNGSSLSFSSDSSWLALGGNDKERVIFAIDTENPQETEDLPEVKFYKLTEIGRQDKPKRKELTEEQRAEIKEKRAAKKVGTDIASESLEDQE